ncbi:MAG: leucine-rich repeat protein, partial [Lentimicrobiaceae bacterium]|nr:leucine-rich repeat protein [Lentimicrobiaceae bacterium]
ESVTTIGEEVFYYCNKLTAINVANDNSHYTSNDGVLFNKSKSALLCCPAGKKGVYVVPDNVTHIEMGAFLNCRNLTAISTPNSLKGIGNRAFYYCDSIVAINLSNGITSIGEEAFAYCTNLLSINIPNALTRISDHTFFLCNGLTSIVIPNNVFLIGAFAFYACANLTSITIPCSVKGFGFKSLAACYNLSEIINLNTEPVSINSCVFASDDLCMYIPADITLRVPNSAVDAYKIAYVWKVFNVEGGGILVNPIPNNTKYGYTKGDGLYELDTTATVTATALPGYQFVNWTKNGEEVSTDTSYTFTVAEDVELVAHFEDDGTGAGIVETRLTAPLQVYPNPTTGEIRIENYELGIEGVEVFDVYGRKQTSHHASPHTSHSSSLIDISHCSAGTYFLRITTKKGIVTKKIVKY